MESSSPLQSIRLSFSGIEDKENINKLHNGSNPMAPSIQSLKVINNKMKLVKKPLTKLAENNINKHHYQQSQHASNAQMKIIQQHQKSQQHHQQQQDAHVSVFLRIRPNFQSNQIDSNDKNINNTSTLIPVSSTEVESIAPVVSNAFKNRKNDKKYTFTKIFKPDTNQDDIFTHTTKKLVDDFVIGKDGLLFTYGVTNSGKTFTVEGTQQSPGIIPHVLEYLFDRDEFSCDSNKRILRVSYLQVYNEQIHDLQDLSTIENNNIQQQNTKNSRDDYDCYNNNIVAVKRNLKIKTNDERTMVENLKSTNIKTVDEGLQILFNGRKLRETQETSLNSLSSRSHSAYIIELYEKDENIIIKDEIENLEIKESLISRLFIVDLAGSERGKRTNTNGIRQKEAMNINLSLMILDRCLETIRDNQKLLKEHPDRKQMRVPYRDSILTMLFRECFTSYNNISMIVCASSHPNDFDETCRALEYGALAKDINIINQKINTKPLHTTIVQINRPAKINPVPIALQNQGINNKTKIYGSKIKSNSNSNVVEINSGVDQNKIQEMDDEINILKEEIEELKEINSKLEEEIRNEVTNEMAVRLLEMDQIYQKRLEEATIIGEERAKLMSENIKKRATDKSQTPYRKRATILSKPQAMNFETIHEDAINPIEMDMENNCDQLSKEIEIIKQQMIEKDIEIQNLKITYTNQIQALNKELDSTRRKFQEFKASSLGNENDILGCSNENLMVVENVNKAVLEVENNRLNGLYQNAQLEISRLLSINEKLLIDFDLIKNETNEFKSLYQEVSRKLSDEQDKSKQLLLNIEQLETAKQKIKKTKTLKPKTKRLKKERESTSGSNTDGENSDSLLDHINENDDDDINENYKPKFKKSKPTTKKLFDDEEEKNDNQFEGIASTQIKIINQKIEMQQSASTAKNNQETSIELNHNNENDENKEIIIQKKKNKKKKAIIE